MFENIKEVFRIFFKSRIAVAAVVMTVLFGVLLWRVFYLQVINGEEYQNNYTLKIIKERTLNSTRGNIYDREGRLLAYNELAYSVTIEDNGTYQSGDAKNEALNAELAEIITALEKNGDSIINDFKIDLNENGSYRFNVEGTAKKRFLADVYGKSSYDDLAYDKKLGYHPGQAAEDQVMNYLLDNRFSVDGKLYDKELSYKIAVVRFAMAQNAFQKYIATTIASNISDRSMAYISEHSSELQGVEIIDDTIRKYNDSEYFASILGYTGKISTKEYETFSENDDSYTLNDVVGKGGIEQYMDSELKGKKGYEKLYVDYLGKAVKVIEREEPEAGNDVYLSIDSELQEAVYKLLEEEIAGIVYSNIESSQPNNINIPITDVFFALINNNVLDFERFDTDEASETERAVHQVFSSKKNTVTNELKEHLTGSANIPFKSLTEEYQDYITYIIRRLGKDDILSSKTIDASDEVYQKWKDGAISPQEYLIYAISQNWIDITNFSVEEKYSDSTEIYDALCNYILEDITGDRDFSKIVYEYLIKSDAVTGRQLCLILFDQKVLAYDAEDIEALSNNSVSATAFIKEKIRDLEITPAQLALDPCSGSCVVTDTKTGEVLALVSYPGYDGNRLANTVDAEYFESLQNDKSLPQYNYATQQGTAPGSTFKMVIATAGLSENYITTGTQIEDLGKYTNISNEPKCWKYPSSHGLINVSEAIRDSCNYFFYEVGYRLSTANYTTGYDDELGVTTIQKYAAMFGFDEKTGIEIEESAPEIADEFPVMDAIGQSNNRFTTVQLARYVTAVANGGTVYHYTLLNKVMDSDGNLIRSYEPTVRNTIDVLDQTEWNSIHSGMRMVVENSAEFNGFSLEAAGKTGTAQQIESRPNHALFVGYAPYNDPQISIATRIAYGYTSHNAAKLSRDVFSYYFKVDDEEELLDGKAADLGSVSNSFND